MYQASTQFRLYLHVNMYIHTARCDMEALIKFALHGSSKPTKFE